MNKREYSAAEAQSLVQRVATEHGWENAVLRLRDVNLTSVEQVALHNAQVVAESVLKIYPHYALPATPKPLVQDTAHALLQDAANTVLSRAAERDVEQERSMGRSVKAFNALTGHQLSERDGWLFMAVLKAARATTTPTGRKDDYVDGAAYFGLAGECAVREGAQ